MNNHINITRIKALHNVLSQLEEKIVFVGGATVSLYADRTVFEVRPTDDVDVLVEIVSYTDRSNLEQRLRDVGFQHDKESGIICRYNIQGITVDIMPTDDASIGFKNIWYPAGHEHAILHRIDERQEVYILSAPYFIATKLEAYKSRGKNDGRQSHDFEDIVFVLENRSTIWEELKNCDAVLNKYLKHEFTALLKKPYINEWISSHTEPANTESVNLILQGMADFAK